MNVGACNAAVCDIAADGNFQPLDMADPAPDRQRIKQCLGGVFMSAVACIDNRGINMMTEQSRSA